MPDAVAAEDEAARLGVPQREREHAVEMRRDVDALLLVEVGDHLDVGAGAQPVPARLAARGVSAGAL